MTEQPGKSTSGNTTLQSLIETAADDLAQLYEITDAPVPIEVILQRPKAGMWKQVNLAEMSLSIGSFKQRHGPRMTVARLLARNICRCEWGAQHGLKDLEEDEEAIRALARAVIMPRTLLSLVSSANLTPALISMRFEVPEEDAKLRLSEIS
jgi:hypothetical protein